jgi:ferrous iron transport protein B
VDTINNLFEGFLIPLTTKLVDLIPSEFIRDMIVDPDFGILPEGISALGLVLPVLFCLYIATGILRILDIFKISILLNKLLRKWVLMGKVLSRL